MAGQYKRLRLISYYSSSYQKITEHNSQGHSYVLAMNHFGDLTQDEYSFFYLGMRSHFLNQTKRSGSIYLEPSHVSLPTEVDWRKEGYVTGVKNQGMMIFHARSNFNFPVPGTQDLDRFVGITAVSLKSAVYQTPFSS